MPHRVLALIILAFQPAAGQQDAKPEAVVLRRIESADVIYVLHRGPYWTLGKAFNEIDEFMAEHGQTGVMFSRFLDDPTKAGATRLRTEVGFLASGSVRPGSRLLRKTLPAHLAATLEVKGPYSQTSSHYQRIHDWIEANGYTAGEGIMEVYPDRSADQSIAQIRIPVIGRSGSDITSSRQGSDAATLCEIKAYTRLAEVLVPDENALPEKHRKWLADVVDRLRVIREIVEIKHGQRAGDVSAMITPLVERGVWLQAYAINNLSTNVVHRSVAAAVVTRQKEAILVALDRIMVRTHLNELAAAEIQGELAKVLVSIQPIVEGRSVKAMRGRRR